MSEDITGAIADSVNCGRGTRRRWWRINDAADRVTQRLQFRPVDIERTALGDQDPGPTEIPERQPPFSNGQFDEDRVLLRARVRPRRARLARRRKGATARNSISGMNDIRTADPGDVEADQAARRVIAGDR